MNAVQRWSEELHPRDRRGRWTDLFDVATAAGRVQVPALRTEANRFTVDESQRLGGTTGATAAYDQHGDPWVFKDDDASTREIAAHRVAHLAGYRTAPIEPTEVDTTFRGKTYRVPGAAQRRFRHHGDLLAYQATGSKSMRTLSDTALADIAREHVLDHLLGNNDTHGENMLVVDEGRHVVGIDKGRGFHPDVVNRYTDWPGFLDNRLDDDVYWSLYKEIRDGVIPRARVDGIYRAAMFKARQVAEIDDGLLEPHARAAFAAGPRHWSVADDEADRLVGRFLERKRDLVADFEDLWFSVYDRAYGTRPPPLRTRRPAGDDDDD